MATNEGILAIEFEIHNEKAGALRRAGAVLEELLRNLRQLDADLAGAAPEARPRIEARRKEQWREAERHLWYLIVQRESLGVSRHEDVYSMYGIPKGMVARL
jgi:hypothetical protein